MGNASERRKEGIVLTREFHISDCMGTGTSVTVNAQYYTDCSLNAVNGGQRVMTLQIDGSIINTMSRPSLGKLNL